MKKSNTTTETKFMAKVARAADKLYRAQQESPPLRELMRRYGHTPTTLAAETGLPIETIYDFQSARRRKRCPLGTADALAKALGLPFDRLVAAWEAQRLAKSRRRA